MENPATMLELRPPRPAQSATQKLFGSVWPFFDVLLYPYTQACFRKLIAEKKRKQNYTYTCFYRLPGQLEALTNRVIPWLIEGNPSPELNINIFACSIGAEAYTIASEIIGAFPDLPFRIHASDLHDETVAQGMTATYSPAAVFCNPDTPDAFITRTFDLIDGRFVVKPEIRAHVEFTRADMLDPELSERFVPADIVLAQNVFFHLDLPDAASAFVNVLKTAKPRAAFLIDGMHLDLKEQLTVEVGLAPLDFKCREIYFESRRHGRKRWWRGYCGLEPILPWRRNPLWRYGTVFLRGAAQSGKAYSCSS